MTRPLRVALISTERHWQGGEEQASQLVRGLRRRGHACVIVALRNRPFAQRMQADGFPVLSIRGKLPHPGRCWVVRCALRRWSVDIVHLNDAHSVTLGGLAAWRLPGVTTCAARRTAFPLRRPGRYRLWCDQILCVSRAAAQACLDAGLSAERVQVVWSGVDPARVAAGDRHRGRQAVAVDDGTPLLLAIGSLVPSKGHQWLLEALPAVLAAQPHVVLAVAGCGPLETTLRDQVTRLGLDRQVRLLGHRTDVPDLLQACDLFVFPSLTEGLGTSLIDAMLARRPIVTTSGGGIPDVVCPEPDEGGPLARIVTPGNGQELSEAIIRALADPAQSATMAGRAEAYARHHFTSEQMVDRTLAAYQRRPPVSAVGRAER